MPSGLGLLSTLKLSKNVEKAGKTLIAMLKISRFYKNHENLKPYHYAIINDLAEFNDQRQQQALQRHYLLGLSTFGRKGILLGLSIIGKISR